MTDAPLIRLDQVRLWRGVELSFGPLSLSLGEGESALLRSPDQGALFRLMEICQGLRAPSGGELRWFGEGLPKGLWARYAFYRRIGLVNMRTQLLSRLTLLENMRMGFLYAKDPEADVKARRALERFDLAGYENVIAALLPERIRRVALYAMAFSKEPSLFLAERPRQFLELDFDFVWDILLRAAKARGLGLLVFDRQAATYEADDFTYQFNFTPGLG